MMSDNHSVKIMAKNNLMIAKLGHEKELCKCGFPQSFPIPHEHDLTEREKRIIECIRKVEREKIFSELDEATIAEHPGDVVIKSYNYQALKYGKKINKINIQT